MVDMVQLCVDSLMAHVKEGVPESFRVFDEDILTNINDDIGPPVAGVVYEGMEPMAPGREKLNLAVFMNFGIFVITGQRSFEQDGRDSPEKATTILQALRDEILGKASPVGDRWIFSTEVPMSFGDDFSMIGYYQRWRTCAKLTFGTSSVSAT